MNRAYILLTMLLLLSCTEVATEANMSKLDGRLQRHLQGTEGTMEADRTPDGDEVYGVFIHTDTPQALRDANITINSVSGNITTARLTTAEIRRASRLPAVDYIEAAGYAQPTGGQNGQPGP